MQGKRRAAIPFTLQLALLSPESAPKLPRCVEEQDRLCCPVAGQAGCWVWGSAVEKHHTSLWGFCVSWCSPFCEIALPFQCSLQRNGCATKLCVQECYTLLAEKELVDVVSWGPVGLRWQNFCVPLAALMVQEFQVIF